MFIRPGKPVENAFIESFNGSFRSECLNAHWFQSIDEARSEIEKWRLEYNSFRPHSSLKDLSLVRRNFFGRLCKLDYMRKLNF